MTRENLFSREGHQKSPPYGQVTKLFLESEFQHKGNKQLKKKKKKREFLANSCSFSRQQQIQNIKLFKYYTKKDKTKFGQNCHR